MQKQTQDFNESFEAYNKKLMYGTDVISVLRKAIDNNGDDNDPSDEYYIDIEFRLTKDVEKTQETYELNTDGYTYSMTKTENESNGTLKKDTNYSLSTYKSTIEDAILKVKSKIIRNPTEEEQRATEQRTGRKISKYTLTYTPFDEFKRRTFKCNKVEYNSKTGRICKLTFIEI